MSYLLSSKQGNLVFPTLVQAATNVNGDPLYRLSWQQVNLHSETMWRVLKEAAANYPSFPQDQPGSVLPAETIQALDQTYYLLYQSHLNLLDDLCYDAQRLWSHPYQVKRGPYARRGWEYIVTGLIRGIFEFLTGRTWNREHEEWDDEVQRLGHTWANVTRFWEQRNAADKLRVRCFFPDEETQLLDAQLKFGHDTVAPLVSRFKESKARVQAQGNFRSNIRAFLRNTRKL